MKLYKVQNTCLRSEYTYTAQSLFWVCLELLRVPVMSIFLLFFFFLKSTFEQGLGAISTILNDHTHTLADC